MDKPGLKVQKPGMLICGSDTEAKGRVYAFLGSFGREIEDMG